MLIPILIIISVIVLIIYPFLCFLGCELDMKFGLHAGSFETDSAMATTIANQILDTHFTLYLLNLTIGVLLLVLLAKLYGRKSMEQKFKYHKTSVYSLALAIVSGYEAYTLVAAWRYAEHGQLSAHCANIVVSIIRKTGSLTGVNILFLWLLLFLIARRLLKLRQKNAATATEQSTANHNPQ